MSGGVGVGGIGGGGNGDEVHLPVPEFCHRSRWRSLSRLLLACSLTRLHCERCNERAANQFERGARNERIKALARILLCVCVRARKPTKQQVDAGVSCELRARTRTHRRTDAQTRAHKSKVRIRSAPQTRASQGTRKQLTSWRKRTRKQTRYCNV